MLTSNKMGWIYVRRCPEMAGTQAPHHSQSKMDDMKGYPHDSGKPSCQKLKLMQQAALQENIYMVMAKGVYTFALICGQLVSQHI